MLTRDQILAKLQLKTETVEIDGGSVRVSEISATDYLVIFNKHRKEDDSIDMATFTPALIAASVVDENGDRIFTDEDAALLSRSAATPFFKLSEACRRINGMSGEETKN